VSALVLILALVLLAAVIAVVVAPLLDTREKPPPADAELERLEAEREAKYREIRDAELDFRTGKLSAEDYAAIDTALRSEALDILNRLERRAGSEPAGTDRGGEDLTPRGP
jgi:hypothetical protein